MDFRLGPSDTDQARAFSPASLRRSFTGKKVLLVAQVDHDGTHRRRRIRKSRQGLGATPPHRFELTGSARKSERPSTNFCKQTLPKQSCFGPIRSTSGQLLPLIQNIRAGDSSVPHPESADWGVTGTSSGESFAVDSADAGQAARRATSANAIGANRRKRRIRCRRIYLAVRMVATCTARHRSQSSDLTRLLGEPRKSRANPKPSCPSIRQATDLANSPSSNCNTNEPSKP